MGVPGKVVVGTKEERERVSLEIATGWLDGNTHPGIRSTQSPNPFERSQTDKIPIEDPVSTLVPLERRRRRREASVRDVVGILLFKAKGDREGRSGVPLDRNTTQQLVVLTLRHTQRCRFRASDVDDRKSRVSAERDEKKVGVRSVSSRYIFVISREEMQTYHSSESESSPASRPGPGVEAGRREKETLTHEVVINCFLSSK